MYTMLITASAIASGAMSALLGPVLVTWAQGDRLRSVALVFGAFVVGALCGRFWYGG